MNITYHEKQLSIQQIKRTNNNVVVIIDDTEYLMPPYIMSIGEYPLNIYEWFISDEGPFTGGAITKELSKEKQYRLSDINIIRDQKISSGFNSSFGLIDTDDQSTKNIMGMYQKAILSKFEGSDLDIVWKMKDDTKVKMTRDEFISLGNEVLEFSQKCYAYSWFLKEKIEKCQTYDELRAIDLLVGWPE